MYEITLKAKDGYTVYSNEVNQEYSDYALNEVFREILFAIGTEDTSGDYDISIRRV